ASPNIGGEGSPTLISPYGDSGSNTVSGSPAIGTTSCVVKTEWSTWFDRHTPTSNTDEIEGMSGNEKYALCGSGTLLAVECQTINNIPGFRSGDFAYGLAFQQFRHTARSPTLISPNGDSSPTIGTTSCVVKTEWSTWFNRHTPTPDTDEIEGMSGNEKYAFCGLGTLLALTGLHPMTQSTSSTLTLPGIETGSQTVVQPTVCATTSHWSSWINRDKPETGSGDKESNRNILLSKVMTGNEKMKFCPSGTIVAVECQRSDGTPYFDTMDIVDCNPTTFGAKSNSLAQSPDFVTCSKENGLECSFLENFPMGCQDYRTPTVHTQTRPGGFISPTANPPKGSSALSMKVCLPRADRLIVPLLIFCRNLSIYPYR
ncbi:hypothetical protein DPMN_086215, partial [Dreissena polymorpha]